MQVRMDLLLIPGGMGGMLVNIAELLHAANTIHGLHHPGTPPPFCWRLLDASGAELDIASGLLPRSPRPVATLPPPQCVLLVPGIWMQNIPQLSQWLRNATAACTLLRSHHAAGGVLAACFNGPALLAEAGVLDGAQATVSWLLAPWFARSYPAVTLQMTQPLVQDERLFCAGAHASQYELTLALIRHFAGEALAQTCANTLLYQPQRSENSGRHLSAPPLLTRDGVVYKARQWLEQHVAAPYSLAATARAAAVSPRTLLRHFQEVCGMSPLDYLHRLRIERAKQLLEVTLLDIPSIMEQCGYQDASAFRRLFRRETGYSPAQHRRAYSVRAPRQWWQVEGAPWADTPTPGAAPDTR